jgi:di/tricarboxylate transporter
MFIISAGLSRTGIAYRLGQPLQRFARSGEEILVAVLMATASLLSALINTENSHSYAPASCREEAEAGMIRPWIRVFFGFSERKAFDLHSSGGRAKSRIR